MAGFLDNLRNIIGFSFKENTEDKQEEQNKLVAVQKTYDDGSYAVGGGYSGSIDLDGTNRDSYTLISRYRDIALQPEFEKAVNDIVNETVVIQDNTFPVKLNLDKVPNLSDNIRDKIIKEFEQVLALLNFSTDGPEIFKRWYVDGRIYFYKVIDKTNHKKGLIEIRYIDPRKMMKVREPLPPKDESVLSQLNIQYSEYYIYNATATFEANTGENAQGVKIPLDTISYVPSGISDQTGTQVLSYIHKAIRPFNALRMAEDAALIYRLSRASEKRVFKIDTGKLPRMQAEAYVRDMMNKFKSRTTYDTTTGEIRTDRRHMNVLDDIWIPFSSDNQGTSVDVLAAGGNLGEMGDIEYYQNKLYEALGVPLSRIKSDTTFNIGRSSEILREEISFGKHINQLRRKFSELFDDLLRSQLLLKGILTDAEYEHLRKDMFFDFIKDNEYEELKTLEIFTSRMDALDRVDNYTKKYYSKKWVRNNILQQSDDEIDAIDKEIAFEKTGKAGADEAGVDDINSLGSDFGAPGGGLGALPDLPDMETPSGPEATPPTPAPATPATGT